MSDPRILVIGERLGKVKHVVPVMSGKGGVGKTIISALLAISIRNLGYSSGLLDLDFTNPSTHMVLGVNPNDAEIKEEKGIKPPIVHGVKYMTLAFFTRDNPSPIRGESINDAFLEILAITRWEELDYLIIDTPPGLSDPQLNILTYLGSYVEPVLVSTPSPLSVRSLELFVRVLKDGGYRVMGLVENMGDGGLMEFASMLGIRYLGYIPFIAGIDDMLGCVDCLSESHIYGYVESIARKLTSA